MTRGRTLVCHSCDKCTNSLCSPSSPFMTPSKSTESLICHRSLHWQPVHPAWILVTVLQLISFPGSSLLHIHTCFVWSSVFYLNRNLFALFNCFSPQLIIFLSVPLSLSVCLILCPPSRLASLCFCISCVHPQQTRDGPVVSSGETLTSDDLLAKVIPPQQTQSKHDL